MSLGLSSTSDVIPFDQNWHHLRLYSTCAGGKKLSEKLRAKFPTTAPGCSTVKIGRLDDAFLRVF